MSTPGHDTIRILETRSVAVLVRRATEGQVQLVAQLVRQMTRAEAGELVRRLCDLAQHVGGRGGELR